MSPQHGDSGYGDGNPSGEALDYLGKNRGLHDKKRNAGEESPTDPCCRVWSHPAFLPSSRAYYKKENESFMNKWVQTEKIIK
jgi:hypothetical protein